MDLYTEIISTIQQIGGVFFTKGIPSVPINVEYTEVKVAPGMEKMVITQMLMHLDDLLLEYLTKEKRVHRCAHYSDHLKYVLDENSDGEAVIPRKVA